MRPLKGWWTIAFSALVALIGVAQTVDWASVIPQQYVGPVLIAIGAVGAAIRYITTTEVGKSS